MFGNPKGSSRYLDAHQSCWRIQEGGINQPSAPRHRGSSAPQAKTLEQNATATDSGNFEAARLPV